MTTTLAPVSNDAAIEEAVTAQEREPGGGLICVPDSFTITHRVAITASAVRRGLPVIGLPDLVRAGEGKFKSHSNTVATSQSNEFFGEEKRSRGYYAHHYQLEVGDNSSLPRLKNARCELQIKTVLHDAWGAKTHDLTYKRAGALDARMNRQVEVLGDVLAGLDQQSELLRHIIEGRWALDERKARVAKSALLKKTLSDEDPSRQAGYLALRQRIIDSESWLANKPTQDPDLQQLILDLDSFCDRGNYDHSICQLFCLLAQFARTVDLGKLAIDRVNSWLFRATFTA